MNFYVLTVFPEIIRGTIASITGRAADAGIINIECINIRDFSADKHRRTDDYPYGGGNGMVMTPQPIYDAYRHVCEKCGNARVVYMTPQGQPFTQKKAEEFSKEQNLIILCGHYEGIDERVIQKIVTDEVSIGDFVLTGGEIAAAAVIDATARLVSGVLGNENSANDESFTNGLLEYPQYTRPYNFMGECVPDVLISGHHENIKNWRQEQSLQRTMQRRPDLLSHTENKLKVAATTLGCKVNFYETEAVLSAFCEKGWHVVDFSQKADVYIVNTCAVTGTSGRKSRQMLRQARETNPAAVVVAVGCFSQLEPDAVSAIADVVVGTKERGKIPLLVEQYILTGRKKISVGDIKTERIFEPLQLGGILERTRAFVKIQDGCDRYCSYCAIPYARGAVRSRPLSDIAKEAERLVKSGFREIVLSGIHLASFGKDFQERTTLTDAIDATLSSGIERIRLGSLEPNVITDSFIEYLKVHKNVCPHFHLSLQSGSDKILRSMRRAYDTAAFLRSAESLYENFPDCAITTDMITGFPGETEQDFYDSLTFAEKIGFMKIHVFPFSKKDGTKAASMEGQITKHVKSERAKKAIDLSQKLTQKFFSKMEGKFVNVLVEKTESGESFGYAENYVPVCIKKEVHSGEIVRVKLDSYDAEKMFSGI